MAVGGVVHFANLTNGTACAPRDTTTRFSRIQSTWCEQKRWDDILTTLPVDMYMAIAAGREVVVHDQSERARLTRAQWQGLSWIRFAIRAAWCLGEEQEYSRSGMNVTAYWRKVWAALPVSTITLVRYYQKYGVEMGLLRPCDCPRSPYGEK